LYTCAWLRDHKPFRHSPGIIIFQVRDSIGMAFRLAIAVPAHLFDVGTFASRADCDFKHN
jgi:hypothetical protein